VRRISYQLSAQSQIALGYGSPLLVSIFDYGQCFALAYDCRFPRSKSQAGSVFLCQKRSFRLARKRAAKEADVAAFSWSNLEFGLPYLE
jgi:hypothetical protein